MGRHGVSVSANDFGDNRVYQRRSVVEQSFKVHDTPTRNDPVHRTGELPKPFTRDDANRFNQVFCRQ